MTVPYQSYLELKKVASDVVARETLLHNLEEVKGNIRCCARGMGCSPHTVYRTLEKKKKRCLKDASHRPKSRHPRHTGPQVEEIILKLPQKNRSRETKTTVRFGRKRTHHPALSPPSARCSGEVG